MTNAPVAARQRDLERIKSALFAASGAVLPFLSSPGDVQYKQGGDPVTEADHRINEALMSHLLQSDEGWLSEETADDLARLGKRRVWVVDPIDGTREFVERIPEWCLSVGLVEDGRAVAGGILNPMTNTLVIGSIETGVAVNEKPVRLEKRASIAGSLVLASRSEVRKGKWEAFQNRGYEIRPTGSVAYKLSLVAAGMADATWTLVPKNEWDVAAGVALVKAAGGETYTLEEEPLSFNRRELLLPGLIAHRPGLAAAVSEEIRSCLRGPA